MNDIKSRAEADAIASYRETHSRDGYALGTPQYPDNREGRRALKRSWRRAAELRAGSQTGESE